MNDLIAIWSIGLAFFVIAAAPGPATLSNALVAMSHGRTAGIKYGAGLTLGLAIWGLVAASGLGVLLQSSVYVLTFLKLLGGLYLFYLGITSARVAANANTQMEPAPSAQNWFLRGLLLNASNPKAVVAWMAALSMGLDNHPDANTLIIATLLCIGIGFLVYVLYSIAFSLESVMGAYKRFFRWIHGTMCGLFTLFGIGLIRSALNR